MRDQPRLASRLGNKVRQVLTNIVAVLDSRLGTARYRWELVHALPPMRRTRSRSDVEAFLAPLRAPAGDQ